MVVTEVRVGGKHKELLFRLGVLAEAHLQGDHSFLDHKELLEGLALVNDHVFWEVKSRVDIRQKVARELAAGLELGVVEQIEKVGYKTAEQGINEPMADSWL